MSTGADIPDPDEQMLARLAQLDLAAAEHVHSRLLAADAPDEVADLGRTYQRLARSLRQTLALKARLKRQREQGLKDARPAKPGGVAIARRIREVRQAVLRVIESEVEDDETADYHEESLEELITQECLRDSFCDEPLDDHIARICLALGLPAEAAEAWRDLPDPPPRDPPLRDPPHDPAASDGSGSPEPNNGHDRQPDWLGSG